MTEHAPSGAQPTQGAASAASYSAVPRASVTEQVQLASGTADQSSTGAISNGLDVAVRTTGEVDLPLVTSRASERPQLTRTRPWPASTTAALGGLGGVALFCDLALHAFGPLGRSYYVVATVMALCLLGVPAGYWQAHAMAPGWRRRVGVLGTGVVVLGAAAWITAFGLLFTDPDAAFTQRLTPAGSALMALGMLVLGVAVLASRRLTGPRAVAPLLVGVYFPVQLVVQVLFFLDGKDSAPGPNGALLGAWGLLWAWSAWSAWSSTVEARGKPA